MYKFRRKGFSRKALRAYLENNPQKKHKCGNSQKCVVADFIADTIPFPKGTDTVHVWGSSITFGSSLHGTMREVEYTAPRWVDRVVRKFDRLKSTRSGYITGERCAKELSDILG